MSKLIAHKSNFTAGEVAPELLGRGDLRAYANGASRLKNVFLQPIGGVRRRPGLRHVSTLPGKGRLIAFEFNTEQIYLIAACGDCFHVFKDGVKQAEITTPWTEAQIAQIDWVQSADTLLVCHPSVPPKKITRTSHTDWTLTDWTFVKDDDKDRIHQPYHKYGDEAVTVSASATAGTVTLTASAASFQSGHVGTRFRISNKEVEITAVSSTTQATASVKETLAGTAATKDWEEQAFSDVRGYPTTVTFHQDRMCIGGCRDLPNQFWMSKSADLFNFDLGEGLDDAGISFSLLSDQVNAIRAVFSGRDLQVFTSGAEWMVTGDPLTPENVQVRRQTRIGSAVDRTIPPRFIDGTTLFAARNGKEIREFLFTDLEQAYKANDLGFLSNHLVNTPVDQDFDVADRALHVVMADGTISTVTIFREEEITGWTQQITDGTFHSICVVGNDVFALVERNAISCIEQFDQNLNVDAGTHLTDATAKTTWTGLDHLDGKTVKVVADGAVLDDATVTAGTLTLDRTANDVKVGLGYTHVVEPLPPVVQGQQSSNQGGRLRLVAATFRLKDTACLRLDTGRGFQEVPFKGFGGSVLDTPPQSFSGDKTVRAFGWRQDATRPLWAIEQDTPLPFNLLSVAWEVNANG